MAVKHRSAQSALEEAQVELKEERDSVADAPGEREAPLQEQGQLSGAEAERALEVQEVSSG